MLFTNISEDAKNAFLFVVCMLCWLTNVHCLNQYCVNNDWEGLWKKAAVA